MGRKILILLLGWMLSACSLGGSAGLDQGETLAIRALPVRSPQDFARAIEVRPLHFPEDHGPHTQFQTEWWYYTGNVVSEEGERFSYQLTIFRRGLTPDRVDRESNFATDQVYFAHFAVGAIDPAEHRFRERFSRGALGLAGASSQPYQVFLEDWSIRAIDASGGRVRLVAEELDMALDLELTAAKPVAIHGEGGLSAKSEQEGNASYYYSLTRMPTRGTLRWDDRTMQVEGASWFDHEWSTSALAEGVVGWDWYSLQLDNHQELMLYVLRRYDGSIEPVSAGTLVRADGTVRHLNQNDFTIQVVDHWQSPESGAIYPSAWTLSLPSEAIQLSITPTFKAQELRVGFTYWEGSVMLQGQMDGEPVAGQGFVELTGYLESMAGVF